MNEAKAKRLEANYIKYGERRTAQVDMDTTPTASDEALELAMLKRRVRLRMEGRSEELEREEKNHVLILSCKREKEAYIKHYDEGPIRSVLDDKAKALEKARQRSEWRQDRKRGRFN